METLKGTKIDVNNERKIPLNELRLIETFSANVFPLIEKEMPIEETSNNWNEIELPYLHLYEKRKIKNITLMLNLKGVEQVCCKTSL